MGSADYLRYAAIMLAAGIGIPVLAALNAALGQRIGSPAMAALCLFCVAGAVTLFVVLATGGGRGFSELAAQPRHLYLAGALVAFYILSITFIAPHFGIGNAVFFVLLGQLIAAAAIDHFGLCGARISPLTLPRASGIALMALGLALTQRT